MDTVWIDARAKKYFKFENVRITNNKCAEVMGGWLWEEEDIRGLDVSLTF